jgi:hypothetical protein
MLFASKDGSMSIIPPVLSLIASLSIGVADTLPEFDTPRNCEAAMKAVGGSQIQTVQQCIADERSARAEIERQWGTFAASLRDRCIDETQVGGGPSYVDILECLRFGALAKPM